MFYLFLTEREEAARHRLLFIVFYVDIFSHLNGNKSWELYKQVRAVLKTYSQPLYSMFCKYFSEFQNISKLYFSLVYKWYLVFVYLQYPAIPSCFSNKIFLHQTSGLIILTHTYMVSGACDGYFLLHTNHP